MGEIRGRKGRERNKNGESKGLSEDEGTVSFKGKE